MYSAADNAAPVYDFIVFAPVLFTFNVGVVVELALLNLTVTVAPLYKTNPEGVPDSVVFAAVVAPVVETAYTALR